MKRPHAKQAALFKEPQKPHKRLKLLSRPDLLPNGCVCVHEAKKCIEGLLPSKIGVLFSNRDVFSWQVTVSASSQFSNLFLI